MKLRDKIKKALTPFRVTNISASRAIASHISGPSIIIPYPYDADTFRLIKGIERDRELVFLGRLVSQKGVDVLLSALHKLKEEGLIPHLTIIGIGDEEVTLREMVNDLALENVEFAGKQTGEALARMLNRHQIMVVPSREREGFGVVALEGIACGCVVVGSESGGLPEAVGPCGVTFPVGDSNSLANILGDLLTFPHRLESFRANAAGHLSRQKTEQVASQYLEVFKDAI